MTTSPSPTAPPDPKTTSHATSPSPATLTPTPRKSRRKAAVRATGNPLSPCTLTRATTNIPTTRGRDGEEAEDYGYNFANARRRSNSSTHGNAINDFKTKFEAVEADPVFEEEYHGAAGNEEEEHLALEKEDSAESTSGVSIEEEDVAKKV